MGTAMIGAIAFDPTIRGILVVLVGAVVLIGSIFMLLASNSGVRVGFLITASALFGWMFLMSSIWVVYGIGLRGRDPAWMATDINYSRETPVTGIPELAKLPAEDKLPVAEDLLDAKPLLHALALGSETPAYHPATLTKLKTVIQPFVTVEKADLAPVARKTLDASKATCDEDESDGTDGCVQRDTPDDDAVAAGRDKLTDLLDQPSGAGDATVGQLLATGGDDLKRAVNDQSTALRDEIEKPLGGWCLLTESDPRRGEAQASADAALASNKAYGDATSTASYIVEDVFFFGGKEPCNPITEESTAKQAWHRLATTFEIKNPKLLAAVTVVKAQQVVTPDGGTPPPPAAEKGASVVTVGMLRNLGNRRFVPFEFALVALIGFAFFTSMLHYRDKKAMEIRSAFSGVGRSK
jgi:hypothetical protein